MSVEQPETFLELCQRTAEEAGVSGAQTGTVPTSVVGNTGELRRIVNWVRNAWADIQGERKWQWLWENATVTIVAGTNVTAQTIPIERYLTRTAFYIPTGADRFWLDYLDWDDFEMMYSDLQIAANNQITAWTVRPDNAIVVNAKPLINTDLRIERYKNPLTLVAGTDQPGMPADLRLLIVYKALVLYAGSDEAGAMRSVHQAEVTRLERSLNRRCLPVMRLGPPITEDD